MKNLILSIFLAASFSAQASFFQEYCSNGAATIKLNSGHVNNSIVLTERSYVNGRSNSQEIEYKRGDLIVDASDVLEIENTSTASCELGSPNGMASWTTITSKKVIMRKADGSMFPAATLGIGSNRLEVSATVICELNGNSRISCTK